jgi:hypothetical protein
MGKLSDATFKWHAVNLVTILINVGITALCVKLYTEYFKDRSVRNSTSTRGTP